MISTRVIASQSGGSQSVKLGVGKGVELVYEAINPTGNIEGKIIYEKLSMGKVMTYFTL